jgi:multimeric flavodoxin WrbA
MCPKSIAEALEFYFKIKETKIPQNTSSSENPFFVRLNGNKIAMASATQSKTFDGMRKEMKCPNLTITDNRHGVGSRQVVLRQVKKIIHGKSGLGHTETTQTAHYDDHRDNQAVRNVALANEAYYNKEIEDEAEVDPAMEEWQANERRRHAEQLAKELLKKKEEAYMKDTFERVADVTERHKIKSEHRREHIIKVYSWTNLEYSAYVFCTTNFPNITPEHKVFFERFLYGPNMEQYGKNVAEIIARDNESEANVTLSYMKIINSSLRAWNKKRISKDGLHCLFNYASMDKKTGDEPGNSETESTNEG